MHRVPFYKGVWRTFDFYTVFFTFLGGGKGRGEGLHMKVIISITMNTQEDHIRSPQYKPKVEVSEVGERYGWYERECMKNKCTLSQKFHGGNITRK